MRLIRKPTIIPGSTEEDVLLIAIGDVHGELDLLKSLIENIARTIPKQARRIELVFLGDVIDRGPASIDALDLMIKGIRNWVIIPLLGNHEQGLLRLLDSSDDMYIGLFNLWMENGGFTTLTNLGCAFPHLNPMSIKDHRSTLKQALGQQRIDYLKSFQSHHRSGDILCVHAGIDPKQSIEKNFSRSKMDHDETHWAWIRDDFLDHQGLYPDEVFIAHGHTVIPGPKVAPHRIGLDTGACRLGILSGASFFNDKMTIFQVTQD